MVYDEAHALRKASMRPPEFTGGNAAKKLGIAGGAALQ